MQNSKQYDLEERTYRFAESCRDFSRKMVDNQQNREYIKQLIRSSGSQAANYLEANESLSRKDFKHRIGICRKEAKESRLWIRLCDIKEENPLKQKQGELSEEALELTKIFGSILEKSK